MTEPNIHALQSEQGQSQEQALAHANAWLEQHPAEERVRWALEQLPGQHALSSSFGIQSAVMLHLVTRFLPDIPVVLVDTGYLFPETYRFVDELVERLGLNLKVYRSSLSPAWQEARLGRLWEQGVDGIKQYNYIHKVEPMQRALRELEVGTWFAGLRRNQSASRYRLPVVGEQFGCYKVHPIIDWGNRAVHQYLKKHRLPYNSLWNQGYVSVGDRHTSQPLQPDMLEEETRFFGLKRECGLHE